MQGSLCLKNGTEHNLSRLVIVLLIVGDTLWLSGENGRTGTRERPSFMIWVDLKPVPKSLLSLTNKASGSGYGV